MSKLSYPKTFSKDKREVRLEGEAYFEVSKNPDKPFEISANGFDVQVLGTSFNISSYGDENLSSISVKTGKVAVVSPLQNQILLAGEFVEIENATDTWTKGKINTDDVSKWKDGKLIFHNQSMKSITRVLERKFNVDFVFKNKRIQDKIISLQIKDQSLKNIMSALQLSADFQYEQNENTITIW
jgi:ferric-dicitrate binding protein FerR (iron transport regulator)